MKKIKYLAFALTLSFLFVSFTACGEDSTASSTPSSTPSSSAVSIKDDFKEYINNTANKIFIPENNEIVKTYTEAIESQNEKIILKAISETLPAKNNALLEKMKAYKPKTTQVQELHNIYIKAVELRKEGYPLLLESLTTKVSDDSATDIALKKLSESDAKFLEYETKRNAMMKDLGLVDASKK